MGEVKPQRLRLSAEWVGHRHGKDGLRGGTGISECEGFMLHSEYIGGTDEHGR